MFRRRRARLGTWPTRTRRLPAWAEDAAAFAGLAAASCALPAFVGFSVWADAKAERMQWDVKGPPCPVVAAPSRLAVGRKPPRSFTYQDVDFTHSFGEASCAAPPEPGLFHKASNYTVCQFNNPGAVTVAYAGRRVVFEAAPGRRLTVTVRRGAASCVVGGWFNL